MVYVLSEDLYIVLHYISEPYFYNGNFFLPHIDPAVMSKQLQAEGQPLKVFYDQTLGSGAYGKVCRAELNELPCAAKLLHEILFQFGDPRSPFIQHRFVQECELLQSLRHPNVVQYLGVACDPQTRLPVLIMELLDGNLTDFLECSDRPIPYHLQVNLWHDIALALTYLHSKHIIHRDLSGNNVLLIAGSRAKVTDFGMSMLTHVDATKCRLTHCPGNAAYMSPEALIHPPVYTEKLDVFSSGVVALQIMTRKFPDPAPSMMRRDDPNSPAGYSPVIVPEIDRRRIDISMIDPNHPMLPVALRCLSDKEQNRPSAQQLCFQLVSLKEASAYVDSMHQKTLQEIVREQEQHIQELQKQIDSERHQNQEQHHVVEQLQLEIAVKGREMQELEQHSHQQQQVVYQQQSTNQLLQSQIMNLRRDIQVLNTRLDETFQELQLKKQELQRTQHDLQQKMKMIQSSQEWEKNLYKVVVSSVIASDNTYVVSFSSRALIKYTNLDHC